jgi:hypothetical protein
MTPCVISLAIRDGSSGYGVRSHHHGGTPNLSDSFEYVVMEMPLHFFVTPFSFFQMELEAEALHGP